MSRAWMLEARVRYLSGVESQKVGISGASATMQASGVPRRGQDLPNNTPAQVLGGAQ